jgi:eukaryotic-like serine/threonine-protein kinase
VLYEAFSGTNPVRGATPAATARRIGTRLEPLARRRSGLPRALTHAIDRALAPAPEDRGTLDDLRHALEHALEEGPRTARRGSRAQAAQPYADAAQPLPAARRLALPRAGWAATLALLCIWQLASGRAGVALLLLAALAPPLLLAGDWQAQRLRGDRRARRLGGGWLAGALAPVLGLAGLAGAFPAIAGQASRWRDRALCGALGYWWLGLAESLLGRRLWLGPPAAAHARSAWEGSLTLAASHAVGPLLTLGTLLGALLWACAAALLPLLVRGRGALLDGLAATLLFAALLVSAPALDAGLRAGAAHPAGRGALPGALLGIALALAARALRGPV